MIDKRSSDPAEPGKNKGHTKMKAYRITATIEDSNGVRVASNNAETLGDAYGMTYLTRSAAHAECEYMADESAEYKIEEIEFAGFEAGKKYDAKSVMDAGFTIDDAGYNTGDYFDFAGRYLGADDCGIEPTHNDLA